MRTRRKSIDDKEAPVNNAVEYPGERSRSDQSGDLQGIPEVAEGDSESVRELSEEGQAFEAEVIDAVETAPDPDVAEVTTREVPEDDVPPEYLPEP